MEDNSVGPAPDIPVAAPATNYINGDPGVGKGNIILMKY